jgi:hypothetical protein
MEGNMFSRKTLLTTAIGLFSLLAANAAIACQGKTVLFEDKFEDNTGGWDPFPSVTFENSAMNIRMAKGRNTYQEQNVAFAFRDADICVEAVFPATESNDVVGLEFWASDYMNCYMFWVAQDGAAGISRLVNGNWTKIHEQEMNVVKKTAGASNLLRVTLKGNLISMYVNGVKYRDQRAQAPTTETRFGFWTEGREIEDVQMYTFKNFKVTSAD